MGWHIEDDGLGVLFSRDIPTLVREEMRPAVDRFLATVPETPLVEDDLAVFLYREDAQDMAITGDMIGMPTCRSSVVVMLRICVASSPRPVANLLTLPVRA